MKGLIGKKVGMTQIFDDNGVVTPVTIIQAGPCFVTQVKDKNNDGYTAVQLGYGDVSPKRLTRGQQGHLGVLKGEKKDRRKDKGIPAVRHLREFRTSSAGEYKVCLLYTSDAADERSSVDLGGRRIIKKKKSKE